jgi:(4-(4-[2-(gamma-L-glutamylamino)ethyl]phenoxymethyl)furan-2-yl)methanamine synthase
MTVQQFNVTGWDIGGAHLKAARCDHAGNIIDIIQVPCPLWQGIEQLELAVQTVQKQLGNQDDIAAITMTGELVDIFTNRQSGVKEILACIGNYIPQDKLHVFAGDNNWLTASDAERHWQQVASRNWLASANFVTNSVQDGLFIDIGSTTCDIIPIKNGSVHCQSIDDHQRQLSRELLYTGAVRTPLIALANIAPFDGQLISLAAEVFATTGDCWSLLGKIKAESIQDTSSDGKSWQKEDCARRLARLLGTDVDEPLSQHWQQLAHWFTEQQIHQITNACLQVLSKHADLPVDAPVIGAGIGRFIAQLCAQRLKRPFVDFSQLITPLLAESADHAPAVAIALLAQQQLT